jgi:hypothetical protein
VEEMIPEYLNCPYCPAQAYPVVFTDGTFQGYACPAKHLFYIVIQKKEENVRQDVSVGGNNISPEVQP